MEPTRALQFAIHCASDRLIVANQNNVSAWSLSGGRALWSTTLPRKLNLLVAPPPKKNFRVTCLGLQEKKGNLKIPTGKSKHSSIDIESGILKKKKRKKK